MNELYIYGNTGADNTQIGTNTLISLTTGIDNTAFGNTVFPSLTTGNGNTGFGTSVGDNAMGNPSFSTAMGFEALKNITSAQGVSGYGYQALTALTTGNYNTALGSGAGSTITNASSNTLMGKNAAVLNTSTTQSVAMGINTITSSNSVVMGNNSQSLSTNANAYNVVIGNGLVANAATIESILIGGSDTAVGTSLGSVIAGHGAAGQNLSNMVENSVIMGNRAAENIQDSYEDVILGYLAAADVDFSQRNVIAGVEAQRNPTPSTTLLTPLEYVVAIGYQAGYQNSAPGSVFVGSYSGYNNTNQVGNVGYGSKSLRYFTGTSNTAFGFEALRGVNGLSTGSNNVAYGARALVALTTGNENVAAGKGAGQTITTGSNNVFVGHMADGSATVSGSVVVGKSASSTANNSVVVGYGANSSATNGIALGRNASVTTADCCQIGNPAGMGGTAVLRFKTQIVANEAWVGGGTSEVVIDNSGNLSRGFGTGVTGTSTGTTPLTLATYSVPVGSTRRIEGLIMGRRTDGGGLNNIYSVRVDGVAKNTGSVVVNSIEEVQVKNDPAWTITYVPVGASVEVRVVGVLGSTINWQAEFRQFSIP